MAFIQIIEVTTNRIDEIREVVTHWVAKTEGKRTTRSATLTQDRDRPNTFVQIVEFPSYEEATANSELPETNEFARQLAELCEAPPVFRNLEVREVFELR
jgi:quinol monooxygenase YgiN